MYLAFPKETEMWAKSPYEAIPVIADYMSVQLKQY